MKGLPACWHILLLLLALCGALRAEKLGEVWPAGLAQGRLDELKIKFTLGDRLVLLSGSRWCKVDGELLKLSSPALQLDGDWECPPDLVDLLRTRLGAVAAPKPVVARDKARPQLLVVLDAGHGGKDPGAMGARGLREKDVALDITKRVALALKGQPITIQFTRVDDRFVDLHQRCVLSNNWRASLFVSIHCNSAQQRDFHGHQLFTQSPSTLEQRIGFFRQRYPSTTFPLTAPGQPQYSFSSHQQLLQWKDNKSLECAQSIGRELRGRASNVKSFKSLNLCVLRETLAPAVLVETDFISNPMIEEDMCRPEWRQKMANDIAAGILSYLGLGPNS